MKNKKIGIGIACIILFLLLICWVYNTFVFSKRYAGDVDSIGIIDDSISASYADMTIYNGGISPDSDSHGETLLSYLNDKDYIGKIYYFSAEDSEGKISSDSIIQGLEWMKENDVERINISLSSKYKSRELAEWIIDNPDILIFCSYNNQDNSFDYPAMLDGTISSGISDKINYKEQDKKYPSYNIIIINNGLHFYSGNSYLSLETMLNY